MNNHIHSLWNQHSTLMQKIERERAKSVPNANQMRSLQRRKQMIDEEIELVEGLVRTLARPFPPTRSGGLPGHLELT